VPVSAACPRFYVMGYIFLENHPHFIKNSKFDPVQLLDKERS
jgi:hypothetical protein